MGGWVVEVEREEIEVFMARGFGDTIQGNPVKGGVHHCKTPLPKPGLESRQLVRGE